MTKGKKQPDLPREILTDKAEQERKYKVVGQGWDSRLQTLTNIFKFVAAERSHFVTLDHAPHTNNYPDKLVKIAKPPVNTKPLRTRYYWATRDLDGYKPGDEGRAELRTERKIGKQCWEQMLKLGGSGSKTLRRGEHPCLLNAPGVNINVYPAPIVKAARVVLGSKALYPMTMIQSQSEPVLYHPDGRDDIMFEIKFDKGIGIAFDGFVEELVEIEIEIKEHPKGMPEKELDKLLDKSETILMRKYADSMEPIFEAKAASLFRHLVGRREDDKAAFETAVKALYLPSWAP